MLTSDDIERALSCATVYNARNAWAYLNEWDALCVVCDAFHPDHRDGFMFVQGVWVEFEPNPDAPIPDHAERII